MRLLIKLLCWQGNLYLSRRIVIFAGNLEGDFIAKFLATNGCNKGIRVFNRPVINPGDDIAFFQPSLSTGTASFRVDNMRAVGDISAVNLYTQHGVNNLTVINQLLCHALREIRWDSKAQSNRARFPTRSS